MTNILDLFELRQGKEVSSDAWGSAVAHSHKVMGVTDVSFTPLVESTQIKDRRGSMAPGYNSIHTRSHATGTISGAVTYEYLPHWLDGVFGPATPVLDTDIYTYSYTAPLTDAPSPQVYTFGYGDPSDADSIKALVGGTVQSFQVSGNTSGELTYTANLIGKSVDTDTFASDAGEADSSITIARGCDVALTIDVSSDAAGTTAVSATWFDFDLNVNTNRAPYWHLGSCNPGDFRPARWDTSLRLGLEINATSMALLDAILPTTTTVFERVVRITATNGTNVITFTMNGVALEAPQYAVDKDGVASIDLMLMGQYNSTLANYLTASVVNSVSTMP